MADIDAIISESLEGLEGRDEDPGDALPSEGSGGEEAAGETGVAAIAAEGSEGTKPEAKGPSKAAIAAVEDKLAQELGIDPKRKVNNIPYPRVQSIVQNREKKILDRLAKTFGLDEKTAAELKWDDTALDELFNTHYTGKIGKYDEEVKGYKTRLSDVEIVEKLMEADPRKFLEALSLQYPQYKEFLGGGRQEPAKVEEDAEPPLTNADGTTTIQMLQAHMAWRDKQGEKKFKTQLEALEKKYSPLIEKEKVREIDSQSAAHTNRVLTDARTNWPGFAEDEKEIFKVYTSSKDGNFSIRDAYNEVRFTKMQEKLNKAIEDAKTGEKKGREATLAELKATNPKDTSVAGGAGNEQIAAQSGDPIENAIREAIAGLK